MAKGDLRPLRLVPDTHRILRVPAQPVEPSEDMVILAAQLVVTAQRFRGLAVAAPQVGRSVALIGCVDGMAVANPTIVEQSGTQIGPEGCLTFPGRWWAVERPQSVVVEGIDPDTGAAIHLDAQDLDARKWCHEIDHLNGELISEQSYEEIVREP